jgi:hypothetical protein
MPRVKRVKLWHHDEDIGKATLTSRSPIAFYTVEEIVNSYGRTRFSANVLTEVGHNGVAHHLFRTMQAAMNACEQNLDRWRRQCRQSDA